MSTNTLLRGLYPITPNMYKSDFDYLSKIKTVIESGINIYQFRCKTFSSKRKKFFLKSNSTICDNNNVKLIINDDYNLIKSFDINGLHIGESDRDLISARKYFGKNFIIGKSCYNSIQLAKYSMDNNASYVSFGAMYPTRSKESAIITKHSVLIEAKEIGYPVLIKAASGGGGRGMKVAMSEKDLEAAFTSAKSEAKAAFGDDRVYMERYLQKPRHIEVQIIGDKFGNTVHLGERECSIQRRHQKVIEEAPSPVIDHSTRDKIGNIASMAVAKMRYLGLGTIEFLFEDGQFFFFEMNTRLQVEHTITETITGIDLVKEQIMIAAGQPISFKQNDVKFNGHAIECRINAEDPKTFIPSPGKITQFHSPCGLGIRIESCVYSGYVVPPYYDSLIAKLIVHASDREQCILRLKQALKEIVIEPIATTIDLHKDILETSVMKDGSYDIRWLENKLLNNN